MDAGQKYTEVIEFDIDEDLVYKIEDWGFLQYSIPAEVFYNIEKIADKNGITQKYAGLAVDGDDSHRYFEATILKQTDDAPMLVDIELTDVDTYLDYILKNKSLSHSLNDLI